MKAILTILVATCLLASCTNVHTQTPNQSVDTTKHLVDTTKKSMVDTTVKSKVDTSKKK